MSERETGFTVIEADNPNRLSQAVGSLMQKGWKLHGPMQIIQHQQYVDESNTQQVIVRSKFYQALFKRPQREVDLLP
jgi:hypothetical protein